MAINGIELFPRIKERTSKTAWIGRRRFTCNSDTATVTALENELYDQTWPGTSGLYAPRCTNVRVMYGSEVGKALVIATYKTKRLGDLRKTQYATIELHTGDQKRKVLVDLKGKVVEGLDSLQTDGSDEYTWKVMEGNNEVDVPVCDIVIKTAYDKFNADLLLDRIGHVNQTQIGSLGNIGRKGALLLRGLPYSKYFYEHSLWYFNYRFAYCGPGKDRKLTWNQTVKSQKGQYVVKSVPVGHMDDRMRWTRDEGRTRHITEWLPMYVWGDDGDRTPTAPESRVIYPEADFSDLGGWIHWNV